MTQWTALHVKLHRTLRQRGLLLPGDRILIAVSGGQDSLCLARLLLDLQPKWNWHLAIAHCDHQWRSDSTPNAQYVETLTNQWQLPFFLETAGTQVPHTEAGAREWRYHALSAIAQAEGYPILVTGHTQSDRAETLLFNLMRGTGADGLQALSWTRNLTHTLRLVRPLLEVSRQETGTFCQQREITVWEDATNFDITYSRNRIRQELLPYITKQFNPNVEQHLAQTAELLRADVEYLETQARELLEQALSQGELIVKGELAGITQKINRRILGTAPLALQRRALRQLLRQQLPKAPNYEQVEKMTALIQAPNQTQTDPFPGGAIARVEGDWIILTRERR
jgi:tRNA(Ile)-lysidine synthase